MLAKKFKLFNPVQTFHKKKFKLEGLNLHRVLTFLGLNLAIISNLVQTFQEKEEVKKFFLFFSVLNFHDQKNNKNFHVILLINHFLNEEWPKNLIDRK